MKYIISALLLLSIRVCCFSQVSTGSSKQHLSRTKTPETRFHKPHRPVSHRSAIGKTMPDGSIVYPNGYTIKPVRKNKEKLVYPDSVKSIRGTGRDYPAGIKK